MKCLETRKKDGMTWRRYRTDDGRIVTTYELPCSALRTFSKKRLQEALAKHERGEVLRARSQRVDTLLAEGKTPAEVAALVGVCGRTARRRRELLAEPKKVVCKPSPAVVARAAARAAEKAAKVKPIKPPKPKAPEPTYPIINSVWSFR